MLAHARTHRLSSSQQYTAHRYVPPARKVVLAPRATNIETVTKIVGDSIIYFTLFYCTLNWYHYKSINDELDKKDKKK
jgi:hypothetical protein